MSRRYRRRKSKRRRLIYNISALLVIAAVVVFIYGPSIKNTGETSAALADTNAANETFPPAAQPKLLEVELSPTAKANPKVERSIAEAMKHLDAKPARIIKAREMLNETLSLAMSSQQRASVKKQLSKLADKWLFSRTIYPEDTFCSAHQVRPGELLSTIGKQFKVPYEILVEINNISRPKALRASETIKAIKGPFHTRIYRSTFTMDLYLQNTFVRSFPVGLGKPGMETPTGLWAVKDSGKLIKPTWTDPMSGRRYESDDPDYPLGSRWIGLEGLKGDAVGRTGFAIHGTKDTKEIGTASSQGCIRLYDADAILVYNLLVPVYSRVEIVE
ncbi:MAG: L,D-transpeptidase family protein [Planctomycetota bacterium]|nr:MAG: L,D-transpeptidase family protein [Planctomycetota bacterium]